MNIRTKIIFAVFAFSGAVILGQILFQPESNTLSAAPIGCGDADGVCWPPSAGCPRDIDCCGEIDGTCYAPFEGCASDPDCQPGLPGGLTCLTCTPINYGEHLERTKLHMDEFLIDLLAFLKKSEKLYLLASNAAELAADCRKANCGAGCAGNQTPVTQYRFCALVPSVPEIICSKDDPPVCETKCRGTTVNIVRDIRCRENKTVTIRESLSSSGGDPPCQAEWVCSDITAVPECGWESCEIPNYNPPDTGTTSVVQHLNCLMVKECLPNPGNCTGQGEGAFGQAPCGQGITAAYQDILNESGELEKLFRKLLELEGSLNALKSQNIDLARSLAVWYNERQTSFLADCFQAKDSGVSCAPITECPFEGNTYYVCKK